MSLNKAPKGTLGLALKFLMIILGSAVYAVGFQFFMYPNSITSGGIIGISMIINELTKLPVGTMTIILNVPLFAIAWRHFGAGFMFSSFIGMALSSAFVDLFALFGIVATTDPMLGAIIGGTIKGAGLGIIYFVGATTGGVDIVAKFMRQRFAYINFGTLILILDAAIIVAYALILNKYESAMYSILYERFAQDEDAFEIETQDALEDTMSSVTSILAILLGGIAGISLIVGGIGIIIGMVSARMIYRKKTRARKNPRSEQD